MQLLKFKLSYQIFDPIVFLSTVGEKSKTNSKTYGNHSESKQTHLLHIANFIIFEINFCKKLIT